MSVEQFREFNRLSSLLNGLSLLGMLIAGFVYARLLPAIPIILTGGRGLGIMSAIRLTKGHGFILFGFVVAAYIGVMIGMFALMLGLLLIGGLIFAVLYMVSETIMGVGMFVVFGIFMLIWPAFFYGYFQRMQVRAYQWVSEIAES